MPAKVYAEELDFGGSITLVDFPPLIENPEKFYYWKGAPDYKNERLAYYQSALINQGITGDEELKLLVAQLIQENGAMDETGIYHNNCVFGIPQFNTCGRYHMKATAYLEKYPEFKDWRKQLDQMAIEVKARFVEFNGELSCSIVGHFHPNGKNGARGLYKRFGNCKSHQYWHSHVEQRLSLLAS